MHNSSALQDDSSRMICLEAILPILFLHHITGQGEDCGVSHQEMAKGAWL